MPDQPTLDPIERLIRDLLHRERLANTVAADTADSLDELFNRIVTALVKGDPTDVKRLRYRRARVQSVLSEIQGILREYRPELEARLKDHLAMIGRAEAVRTEQALVATLGEVGERVVRHTPITQQRLRAILNTDPFRGRILKEHTARLTANVYDRTLTQIRLGMVREESVGDIVRRIRGTRVPGTRSRFSGGVLQTTTREAEALARTAVNHVSNVGMVETFNANADILSGVKYVATLDERTTEICASLDGSVWPMGSDEIRTPPQHWNCRSILVPEVDWKGLGLDPPPDGTRAARDADGKAIQVPSSTTYQQWLKGQPASVQNRVLGKGKAELFRDGEISLSDVVRQDNSIVPLSELGS